MAKKKTTSDKIVLVVLLVLAIILFIVAAYSVVTLATHFGSNYQKALAAENQSNICATPAGYTDEQWRTHMSHHPDMYKQCLGG